MFALEDVDLFNILCLPRAAELAGQPTCARCTRGHGVLPRRRAFLLIDIPESIATLDAMQTWLAQNDSLRDRERRGLLPAHVRARSGERQPAASDRGVSGTVAGLFARTDATRGVWKAPAGTEARLRERAGARLPADRPAERRAQPARRQLPAHLPDLRPRLLGRAHARRRRPARQRVEVHPDPPPRAVHRESRCSAAPSGWCSSRTTSRCGRRSG